MNIKYKSIIYNTAEDLPMAVFYNKERKFFYFPLSPKTANHILDIINNNDIDLFNHFLLDIFKESSAKILKIKINYIKYGIYFGKIILKINNKIKQYNLTADELILISVLVKKNILVNPEIFMNALNYKNPKLINSKYYPGLSNIGDYYN